MLHYKFYKKIPKFIKKLFLAQRSNIEKLIKIKHEIRVSFIPAKAIIDPDDKVEAFGIFSWVNKRDKKPEIFIAAQKAEKWMDRQCHIDMLFTTLLHELCHYEQFRDGKSINERNIERRANSLYRKLLEIDAE